MTIMFIHMLIMWVNKVLYYTTHLWLWHSLLITQRW